MSVTGVEFVESVSLEEDVNTALSLKMLRDGQLGKRVTKTYSNIGDAIVLLTMMASCHWGCRGGDHSVQNFVRRMCNNTHAALRLNFSGYYEEALSLVRAVAEGVNLLQLFVFDSASEQQWKANPLQFTPFKVDAALKGHTATPAISRSLYKALCEIGVHIAPAYLNLSHDPMGNVHVGASVSVAGLTVVASQTAHVLSPALKFAAKLLDVSDPEHVGEIEDITTKLLVESADLTAENYKQSMEEFGNTIRRDTVVADLSALSREEWQALTKKTMEQVAVVAPEVDVRDPSEEDLNNIIYPVLYGILEAEARKKMTQEERAWRDSAGGVAYRESLEKRAREILPDLLPQQH
jgi:hypothetical protein